MIWILIVGYCCGIRHERSLCGEVELTLLTVGSASWISTTTFPTTRRSLRTGRIVSVRAIFYAISLIRVAMLAMAMGLVKGEGFTVDASVMEANASRYYRKALG